MWWTIVRENGGSKTIPSEVREKKLNVVWKKEPVKSFDAKEFSTTTQNTYPEKMVFFDVWIVVVYVYPTFVIREEGKANIAFVCVWGNTNEALKGRLNPFYSTYLPWLGPYFGKVPSISCNVNGTKNPICLNALKWIDWQHDLLKLTHHSDGNRVRGVLSFEVEGCTSIVAAVVSLNTLQNKIFSTGKDSNPCFWILINAKTLKLWMNYRSWQH